MITRGTTPYHSFVLPLSSEQIETLYITYLQNGQVVLDKGLEEIELHDLLLDTDESFITDTNKGDSLPENNEIQDENEHEIQPYSEATVHLTQEDTLAFKFWPAAEKNIAVIQVRAVTTDGEAYASEPFHERIFGVLKDGVIGGEEVNG